MADRGDAVLGRIGRLTHRFAAWIVLFWVVLAAALTVTVPQLEHTVSTRSADFVPADLPANKSLEQMAKDFGVPASNAVGSVVLVSRNGFGAPEQRYYGALVRALVADKSNVAYVLDTYGNPVTRDIALSPDGKAVTVLVASAGSAGSTRAHHATIAIRDHIAALPRPDGLTVHFSGPTPTLSDLFSGIDMSLLIITGVSVLLITVMLALAYRRFTTALIPLLTVGLVLAIVRPVVSLLGAHGVLPVSNFTIAIMTALVLGAGTDYAIFGIANYHRARRAGAEVVDAVTAVSVRTAPILIASALTIAAACASMVFTKIGMFATAGPPTAIAVLITLAIALTLPNALLSLAGRRGLAEPRPSTESRWQHRGARVIRHAGVYTTVALIFLIGTAAATTTLRLNWDESAMPVHATDSTRGYDAVRQHYPTAEISPEYVTFRADHDLRNTADLASLELAAMALSKIPEVGLVRSITRPDGKPLAEAATGYQTGIVGGQLGAAEHRMSAAEPQLRTLAEGAQQLSTGADAAAVQMPALVSGTQQVVSMADTVLDGLDQVNGITRTATGGDSLAQTLPVLRTALATAASAIAALDSPSRQATEALTELDGVFRPLVGEPTPQCTSSPACASARAAFAQLDRALGGRASAALTSLHAFAGVPTETITRVAGLLPQLNSALNTVDSLLQQLAGRSTEQVRADLARLEQGVADLSSGMSQLADGLHQVRDGTAQVVALTGALTKGLHQASEYLTTMGDATSTGAGAGFYLPPDALHDKRFVAGSRLLISPNGRTARMIVTWKVNPYSQEAMAASRQLPVVARRALTGTTLADASVSTAGLASLSADMQDQLHRDFLIFASVAAAAVLVILTVLLRSILAPVLLVGTVILSFASAVGVSVLVWQHVIGIDLDWSVIPVSFMALIAVGADYSMLFADRIREESRAGMVRGIIRGFGSTGGVITTAGVVFAVTMFALMSGTVLNLVQIGFTIGVGLLLDIAIVRTVLVPAAMAVIGERIWWPSRPTPTSRTAKV
ncbi:MMPL family transporter [Gordonia sp. N1V]|uniref:MMPL family transporter n=1 Tax=Gordonia sp. N1V TaxID=3034163 RepID=UPI0023E20BBE|nr:MMPL family transporter [Gordonia sp. N1V]